MDDYYVVSDSSKEEFEQRVANLLKNGWQCQGGVSVYGDGILIKTWYYQAMIRKVETSTN